MTGTIDRRAAVAELTRDRGDLLVVSGLGSPTYDLFAAGDDHLNFYLWGAMGAAAVTGLGLALARPERPVLALTGDGEMLMGLGAFATVAQHQPHNLWIVILDNESYGETGAQPSATGQGTDLAAVAHACGIARTCVLTDLAGVASLREALHAGEGPGVAVLKIDPSPVARALPLRDGVAIKTRFRSAIGNPER